MLMPRWRNTGEVRGDKPSLVQWLCRGEADLRVMKYDRILETFQCLTNVPVWLF